jgi:hypothetical protein
VPKPESELRKEHAALVEERTGIRRAIRERFPDMLQQEARAYARRLAKIDDRLKAIEGTQGWRGPYADD